MPVFWELLVQQPLPEFIDRFMFFHDIISWTRMTELDLHELWHSVWIGHSLYHTPCHTGCMATSYPNESLHASSSCTYRQKSFHTERTTASRGDQTIEASQSSPPRFDSGLEIKVIVSERFIV